MRDTEIAPFLLEIRRKEVAAFGYLHTPVDGNNVYAVVQSKTKALGPYQILPDIWADWAPKALGTDPTKARAGFDIPYTEWEPKPTPYRQDRVALWRALELSRRLGDARRCAAAWLGGEKRLREAPQPADWVLADGTAPLMDYANKVCAQWKSASGVWVPSLLGYEEMTPDTVLPDIPARPAPSYEELDARVNELYGELNTALAELHRCQDALRAQEYATEEQRQRATVAENHRDRVVTSGTSLLGTLHPFETVATASNEFRRTL